MTSPLRIGVLGAARISPPALFIPARDTDDVVVVAIAARDRSRAQAQADEFGIERVYDTYEEVLADPEVDAIYNPLPVNAHLPWGVKALEAGKHLLQEKPLTSNAADARTLVAAGERAGLVMMEAFHWRYHPLAARLLSSSTPGWSVRSPRSAARSPCGSTRATTFVMPMSSRAGP
ncbi:MAG: Gfo/Idh/MocA family oxidoreductase [Acidimicrobiales bacterium]